MNSAIPASILGVPTSTVRQIFRFASLRQDAQKTTALEKTENRKYRAEKLQSHVYKIDKILYLSLSDARIGKRERGVRALICSALRFDDTTPQSRDKENW